MPMGYDPGMNWWTPHAGLPAQVPQYNVGMQGMHAHQDHLLPPSQSYLQVHPLHHFLTRILDAQRIIASCPLSLLPMAIYASPAARLGFT